MSEIWAGIAEAFRLIWSLDEDLIDITIRSLKVSLTALFIACTLALPFGTWLAICLSPLELCHYILAKGVRKHGSEAIF
jgi:ABC-type tungstate transport system substrate-binding protein